MSDATPLAFRLPNTNGAKSPKSSLHEAAESAEIVKLEEMPHMTDHLPRDAGAIDKTPALFERAIQELKESFREQFDKLRDEIADRDEQIIALLQELQWPGEGGQTASTFPASSGGKIFEQRQYQEMIERIRKVIADAAPENAKIAVVNKGDPELLHFTGRVGWHFPQEHDGSYIGFHPKDSADAIARLKLIQAKGAAFLVFPATSLWWLEYYADLAKHLHEQARVLVRDDETCVIFDIRELSVPAVPVVQGKTHEYSQLLRQLRSVVTSLLPQDAKVLVVTKGDSELMELGGCVAGHFPQDEDGNYAGYYPADSGAAIDHLEKLRQQGAQFLVFPTTALWWLNHYHDFRLYLEREYRLVTRQRHVCTIFDLQRR